MRLEVRVLEAVGRQVGVELRGRDVGVAEHLLQRAQVAAARQQVRRERVAQRVRAHLRGQPGRARVALDDLVEPLARQPGAAVVEEQARLQPVAGQPRAAALEVDLQRAAGGRADRDEPLLGALAARAQDALLEVHVADLEPGRLGGAQPAGVHDLQQRAVAQRGRLGALGLLEQERDLVAAEDLRELAGLARSAQVRGRVVGQHVLAAEMAVEGAQAGDLALHRGVGHGRALAVTAGELGHEGGEVGVLELERVLARLLQVRAELQQVRAVGLERVAGEPALELEVGEEVEHEVLECVRSCDDGHAGGFAAARAPPAGATQLFSAPRRCLQPREPDDRLRVGALGDQRLEVRQRADLDVDALVLVHLGALVDVGDAGGEEQVHDLVGEAGRRVEEPERLPLGGLLADLLGELALGGVERLLALLVELAGGDLQQVGHADRLARLADEPQRVAVERDDARPRRCGRRSRARRSRRPRGGTRRGGR